MLSTALLLGLVVALVFVLMSFFKKPTPPTPASPAQNLAQLNITQARVGDALSIAGAGTNFADLEFTVDRRNIDESGGLRWTEVSGLYENRRVTLTVHDDDELQVNGALDPVTPALENLGVTEEDLAQLDEQQNSGNVVEYEGKPFHYEWSREVRHFRDGAGQGEGYYAWQFREESGSRKLVIRKREGQAFQVSVERQINPGDISVYRA